MEILPTSTTLKNTTNEVILQKKIEGINVDKDAELRDACRDFESIFIHMMLKEMRKTIPEGGFVEKSTASKMFEDMLDEEISKEIAKKDDGLGIAKMMYEQLKRQNLNL